MEYVDVTLVQEHLLRNVELCVLILPQMKIIVVDVLVSMVKNVKVVRSVKQAPVLAHQEHTLIQLSTIVSQIVLEI